MLIKSADDKSKRLKLLEELQASPLLELKQKDWLHKQLRDLRTGIQGEKDAAHYINAHYGDSPNFAVLHDLRLEVDGEVAQIDHLLVGRAFVFLLETKNFNGNVSINEYGEFTVTYPDSGQSWGIPSPLEQSRRHEKVLRKLLDRLDIRPRVGDSLEMHHVVLFHPRAIIQRPDAKAFDSSNIIKADNLPTWREKFLDKELSLLKTLTLSLNLRSQDTVREWGEKIKRQHRPADPLALPDFMRPQQRDASPAPARPARPAAPAIETPAVQPADAPPTCATCGQALGEDVVRYCRRHAARFGGQLYCREHQTAKAPAPAPTAAPPAESSPAPAGDVCAECGQALAPKVADYCRQHASKFGGKLYCWTHQRSPKR